jgi:hypothetical protein
MKKLFLAITGALMLGAALPAIAGVDFQALEHARKVHRAPHARMNEANPQDAGASKPLVLPLDHGPRAQSTPYLNRQHTARVEAPANRHPRS